MTASRVRIAIERLAHHEGLPLPAMATSGAAGADVVAAIESEVVIPPGGRMLIPTGLRLAIPPGWEIQVRPRSGLALKHGITLPNSPGTIDSDYRGELGIIVLNAGSEPFTIRRGDRIAQLVLVRYDVAEWEVCEALEDTARGEGGFGHTG